MPLVRLAGRGIRPVPVLQLRHPWADGTTALTFEPTAFRERLAVLVPRPRINLVRYHGVLAPRAAWRARWCSARRWSSLWRPAPLRHPRPSPCRPTTARARDGPTACAERLASTCWPAAAAAGGFD